MKKLLTILLVVAFVLTLSLGFAFADNDKNDVSVIVDYSSMSAEELAYVELADAPAEWQQKILDARYTIIYSNSWTADGQGEYVHPDGTVEKLPKFSDLFPGWDMPKMDEKYRLKLVEAMQKNKPLSAAGRSFFRC
jgi:hypothetical protein